MSYYHHWICNGKNPDRSYKYRQQSLFKYKYICPNKCIEATYLEEINWYRKEICHMCNSKIIKVLEPTMFNIRKEYYPFADILATVGLTSGVFDLFHNYHLKYLERCKHECDFLIVGVDSDSLVQQFKGPTRPIFPEIHRLNIINSLKCVDAVFLMNSLDDLKFALENITPNKLFKNENYDIYTILPSNYKLPEKIELITIPDINTKEIHSTSEFIKKIKNNN